VNAPRILVILATSAAAHAAVLGGVAGFRAGSAPVLFVDLTVEEPRTAPEPARVASATPRPAAPERAGTPSRRRSAPTHAPAEAPPRTEPTRAADVPGARPVEREEPPAPPILAERMRPAERVTPAEPTPDAGGQPSAPPATSARPSLPSGGAASGAGPEGAAGGHAGSDTAGDDGGSRLAVARPGPSREGVPAEYTAYLNRFRQRVQETMSYPSSARRRGISGTVQLEVSIDVTGRVRDVEVSASSAHAVLDEAAVDAVRRMAPLPFPVNVPPRPLRVRLPLVFELR
jgi:periplasmic protein TonB